MSEECARHIELIKRVEQNEKDIRKLEDKSNDISIQFAKQDTKLDYIKDGMRELQENVRKFTEQPAKRWDTLVTAGLTCIVSLLISGTVTLIITKH